MDEQKSFSANLPSRIWKIGSLTTGVSTSLITNKIKEKFSRSEEKPSSGIPPQIVEKIVKAMGELKGPWMKIGQYMSLNDTYTDDDFFQAFSSLQYESPSMSYYFTKMQIEKELGKSPDVIFKNFGRKPIGAASIGQVHEAYLQSGEKVAVKVQYPDMDKIIKSDLTTLKIGLLPLKLFLKGRLEPIIEEIQSILVNELDYSQEAENIDYFREFNKNNPHIVVPEYYKEFSSKKVLTMKFIEGSPFEQAIKDATLTLEERNNIGKILIHSLLNQLFLHKRIHADPHPGNFLLIDKETIGMLDFGCIKTFNDKFISDYKELIKGIISKDSVMIRRGYVDMGFVEEHETEKLDALEEFSEFMALPYRDKENFDLAENMSKLKEGQVVFKKMSDKVGFRIPKDFIYLNRTLFGIGMILFKLRVNLNFYNEVESYLFA
ncbi:MAG: AarF/ABC1/UbiB kinase family protein [Candidatus Sericytochromatia bacterium]|nr:AarF/ABC1/UbiB kinase family protein [Candidatus Sericytochromatia bacterium]